MTKPSDHDAKLKAVLTTYFKESEWTHQEKLKGLAVNVVAAIASLVLLAIPLLGIARSFGLL